MPVIDAEGCPLWVEIEGPPHALVLMLSNSLGTDLHMWDAQAARFAQTFRLVRYDRRGHGRSGVPAGPYGMERLGRDALARLAALADRIVALWFSPQFRARAPSTIAAMKSMLLGTPDEGYVACCAAIRDMDLRDLLARISAPTLVIAGRHDQATPLSAAQFIHSRIAGAALAVLDAAHISNVEQPDRYADAVLEFLAPHP